MRRNKETKKPRSNWKESERKKERKSERTLCTCEITHTQTWERAKETILKGIKMLKDLFQISLWTFLAF